MASYNPQPLYYCHECLGIFDRQEMVNITIDNHQTYICLTCNRHNKIETIIETDFDF